MKTSGMTEKEIFNKLLEARDGPFELRDQRL